MCSRRDGVRLSLLLSALLISACIAGCGKIGPPLAPLTYFPAQTEDFSVQQLGNQLLLTMSYPTTTTSGLALEGIGVLKEQVDFNHTFKGQPLSKRKALQWPRQASPNA